MVSFGECKDDGQSLVIVIDDFASDAQKSQDAIEGNQERKLAVADRTSTRNHAGKRRTAPY